MSVAILVVPTHRGVGTTSICLGLLRAFERQGLVPGFCKPIAQNGTGDEGPERSTTLVERTTGLKPPTPVPFEEAEHLLSSGDEQVLMERVVEAYGDITGDPQVVVVEGLVPDSSLAYADKVNEALARTLDAGVILVSTPEEGDPRELAEHLAITASGYGGCRSERILGCIVNKVPVTMDSSMAKAVPVLGEIPALDADALEAAVAPYRELLEAEGLRPLGFLPRHPQLSWLRVADVQRQMGAKLLTPNAGLERRISGNRMVARSVPNALGALQNGFMVIVPGDREDILLAATVATLGGVRLAAILLTGGLAPDPKVFALCRPALDTGLPVLLVDADSYETANAVDHLDREVPSDDVERVELVMNTVAGYLDSDVLAGLAARDEERRLSPPAFRHQLIELARSAGKRIVLPEGAEPRTLRAAAICEERGIAHCVLLGDPDTIREEAQRAGVNLPDAVEIIDAAAVAERYVEPLVELRKHKGMTPPVAREELADTVVLGTMMLKLGEVDGLVSGAIHTTANTIRPALQFIKTAPGQSIVSSVFFMCLPDQVLVYGDCAVNPEPSAEELSEIALQSAASAKAFGIPPRVAMISYSTGSSGAGAEVEKVRAATDLAKAARPDMLIDGPLQYDAAAIKSVAKSKAPDSQVAGKATVFVFPDLNTGNTTYKAVQRSAGVVSIGPMLQGMAKPVNDLSRGALVEDIVYTIALTAIQAASDEV